MLYVFKGAALLHGEGVFSSPGRGRWEGSGDRLCVGVGLANPELGLVLKNSPFRLPVYGFCRPYSNTSLALVLTRVWEDSGQSLVW